jgi:hypothetical protein
MNEALKRIIKDRDYHMKQIEENLMKIQQKYEAIQSLEESTERERQLVEEYNAIIEKLKED